MKDHNAPEQTEFDFNESGETEQQRLEREVLAAGGCVGRKEGWFVLGLEEGCDLSRGDEHSVIKGLYFWSVYRPNRISRWVNYSGLIEEGGTIRRKKSRHLEGIEQGVIACGGRSGDVVGNFILNYGEAEGCKRGDEHPEIAGLYYWVRHKSQGRSDWMDLERFSYCYRKERSRGRRWSAENKEREFKTKKRYREENREKLSKRARRWDEKNRDKLAAKSARRRAKLREALDPSASKAIIESRYAAQLYLKEVTGCDWHVDHTQPLSLGGKEHENNLQVVPAKWNCSKGNHHCDRWIEDSDIYRYATAVEARFEREAKKNEKK